MEITIRVTVEQVKQLDIALRRYDPNVGDVYCSLCGVSQQGKPTHGDDCLMQQFWTSAGKEMASSSKLADERKGDTGSVPSIVAYKLGGVKW